MQPKRPTSLFRYVSAVLLSALLLFPLLSLTASALTPYSYNMSSDYKNSIYYDNLTSLTLTGNGARDVLAVAMSQLGYHEGNGNSDFGGGNTSGRKNFVEYNRLYGKLDNGEGNGYSYGYAWCAAFVNWCLRQAGVSTDAAGGEVSCSRWIRDFLRPNGMWKVSAAHGGDYTPKPGDLIFFKNADSNALSTHVGLVRYADTTYVHTVEGNTASGEVALDAYLLDSTYVIGYGTPRYETNGKATCDYSKSGELAGIYVVTADSLNVRAAASSGSKTIGGLKKSELVTVKGFEGGFARIVTSKGLEGYASHYYLELVTVPPPTVYTVTFLDGDGSTVLLSLECEENTTPEPPTVPSYEKDGTVYTFSHWSEPLVPVVGNAIYVAVYEERSDGASDTDGESVPKEEEIEAPPEVSEPVTEGPTTDADGNAGCGSVVGAPALFLCAFLPLFPFVILRKKR